MRQLALLLAFTSVLLSGQISPTVGSAVYRNNPNFVSRNQLAAKPTPSPTPTSTPVVPSPCNPSDPSSCPPSPSSTPSPTNGNSSNSSKPKK